MTTEVTLEVEVPQITGHIGSNLIVARLSELGGELRDWRRESNGDLARATFKFETQAQRDFFLARALDIPGVSVVTPAQQGPPKNESRRVDILRARYRRLWDAHQVIAERNARLVEAGQQPSNEQLIDELRAAKAVQHARDELISELSAD